MREARNKKSLQVKFLNETPRLRMRLEGERGAKFIKFASGFMMKSFTSDSIIVN